MQYFVIYLITAVLMKGVPVENSCGGQGMKSVNSLSAKKQTAKLMSAKILIIVLSSCIILRIQRLDDKQSRSR